MHWYFQVRVHAAERSASRILQVLETQRVLPSRFEARQCQGAMHLQFFVQTDEKHAGRIGWLLRRAHAVEAAHWLVVRDAQHEKLLWRQTAFALWSENEAGVDLDPCSPFWQSAPSTLLLTNNTGERVHGHDTEVRMRWTDANLYLLFDCSYQDLHVRAGEPSVMHPTPRLWEHDVAELFLSDGADALQRYAEFEVSPRGEWIDLDITAQDGAICNTAPLQSRVTAAAEVREPQKRWLAFLRVPLEAFSQRTLGALRLNLFRSQGPQPVELAWLPTHHVSFHVPSSFGYLHLLRE